eukprot:4825714-Heterocapsa_arctica.AAC.1
MKRSVAPTTYKDIISLWVSSCSGAAARLPLPRLPGLAPGRDRLLRHPVLDREGAGFAAILGCPQGARRV